MNRSYTFDDVDKAILADIEAQFPVEHRPFQALGQKLGLSEQECLSRIDRLKAARVIRQISAVFDARALGYRTSVVAMRIEPARAQEAVRLINQHPGVSHSYALNDRFNLWFIIHVPPADSLEQVINVLHALAKSDETIVLPALRFYKAGTRHDLTDEGSWLEHQEESGDAPRGTAAVPPLTEQDIRFIRIAQEDLPLLEIPYAVWAEQVESSEEEFFAWAKRMEHLGYMNRFAAVFHHRHGESLANTMVVWQVPPERVDAIGCEMALFREVIGCYRYPTYPNWPYPLCTAIRAATSAACMEVAKRIEERVGRFPHKHLFSAQEHKRVRIAYFSPDLDAWRQTVGVSR